MGAGQFPAGGFPGGPFTRAGVDPVFVAPSTPAAQPFRSVKFDLATRTFVMNTDGSFYDVHPVDQRVAMLLWIGRGSIPSASSVGHRIRQRIARVATQRIPGIVRDEVKNVLRPLIDAGDIQLTRIDVNVSIPGRTEFAAHYKNLRDTSDNTIRKVTF